MSDLNFPLGDLGRHDPAYSHPPGALTLHETGELIRRAGLAAGFVVKSEVKVGARKPDSKQKADWGWFQPGVSHATVLFEVEGRNVADASLNKDARSFADYEAPLSVLVLFSVNHDHRPKGKRRPEAVLHARVNAKGRLRNFKVLDDTALFEGTALRALMAEALAVS